MFRHQGPGRSESQNRFLAGYLAFVGGFVNCASLILIGAFTSHVTGNVGRLGNAVAFGQYLAALAALTMIAAFFVGAFFASMVIESSFFGRTANAYAFALLAEALLLVIFMATVELDYFEGLSPSSSSWLGSFASSLSAAASVRRHDVQAGLLCAAMGMQNSLVTRLSGAVVRTTHLTGVVTDLGIEAARWFRWWRGSLAKRVGVPLAFGRNPPERPAKDKSLLLGTIALAFGVGAVGGAALSARLPHEVMAIPVVALLGCALYAYISGRAVPHHEEAPKTRR